MNSAPVQLLPIESGSGYKQKPPDKEGPVDNNGKFDDVFSKTVSESESKQAEKKAVDNPPDKSSPKKKTEASESGPEPGKKKKESDVSVREDVSSEKTADSGIKQKHGLSVKSGKKGASANPGGIEDEKKIKGELKKSGTPEKVLKNADKSSEKGGLKTARESGAAAVSGGFNLKDLIAADDVKSETEPEVGDLSDKLKPAAVAAEKTGEGDKTKKAEIRLVTVVPQALKQTKNDAGKDNPGKADTVKAGDKLSAAGSDEKRSKFRVVDHRKTALTSSDGSEKNGKSISVEPAGAKPDTATAPKDGFTGLRYETARFDSANSETRTMQSAVLSQLKDSINNQIVKQAGIIVKGDGTGEIKLVMKPESLGKVRIQLSMHDNHIAGRIIVENNIVREIFESNLANLYKAFGAGGFENGGLEVSVQGQGGNTENGGRRSGRGFNGRVVKALEDAVPEFVDNEWRSNAVNMVV